MRFDLSFPYRAIPPHTGALLQQQQMQAPILFLGLMGRFLSYSDARESQFTKGLGGGSISFWPNQPVPALNTGLTVL